MCFLFFVFAVDVRNSKHTDGDSFDLSDVTVFLDFRDGEQ